jgi:hypothetical protein
MNDLEKLFHEMGYDLPVTETDIIDAITKLKAEVNSAKQMVCKIAEVMAHYIEIDQ